MFIPIDLITSRQTDPFIIHACKKPGKGKLSLSQKKKEKKSKSIHFLNTDREDLDKGEMPRDT